MLPINLLPNYIFDKNKKRNVLIGYGLALAAIVAFFLVMSAGIQKTLDEAKADLADATTKQGTYNTRVSDITKVQGEIAEIKTKQTFIANAQTYNNAWPATFELFRNLTAHDILLKSMVLDSKDHKTMHLSAFAPGDSNTAEFAIAKWVKALESHPDIIERVSFTVPPHPFVGMAPANGAGGMAGAGAGMGMPGSSGMGRPSASGFSGMGGSAGMMGLGGKGMAMSGIGGGAPGGGAGGNDATGPAEIEGKPGINFNVNATLKTALANGLPVPTWGGNSGATAPTGGFGGAMGSPSGMGGPPVGMPGVPGSAGMGGASAGSRE